MPSKEIRDQQAPPDSKKILRGAHPAEVRLSEPVGVQKNLLIAFFSHASGEKSFASGYNMFPTDPHYKEPE